MATYPNITWPLFAAYNDDARKSFEDMCRRLFTSEFLKDQVIPHTDPNLAGIEVLPVWEPERDDGQPRKRISFQAKYKSLCLQCIGFPDHEAHRVKKTVSSRLSGTGICS